jgi:hypothetical protein
MASHEKKNFFFENEKGKPLQVGKIYDQFFNKNIDRKPLKSMNFRYWWIG